MFIDECQKQSNAARQAVAIKGKGAGMVQSESEQSTPMSHN